MSGIEGEDLPKPLFRDDQRAQPDAEPNCKQTSQFSDVSLQIHELGFAISQSVSFSLTAAQCLLSEGQGKFGSVLI